MSPLALPRDILDDWVDRTCPQLPSGALRDVVGQLKQRPVFAEQWPDTYRLALVRGKNRLARIDALRGSVGLGDILKKDQTLHEWYQKI